MTATKKVHELLRVRCTDRKLTSAIATAAFILETSKQEVAYNDVLHALPVMLYAWLESLGWYWMPEVKEWRYDGEEAL